VAKKANLLKEQGRGGHLSYFLNIFTGLFQFRFIEAVIEVDDQQVFRGEIFSMNVGICKYSGGGMIQVPFAIPDDGLFDITLIKKAPKWMVIRYAKKLYDGTLVNLDFVNTYKGKSVRIRATGKLYLEADGESLGNSPFFYEILPGSLKIVTGL
jgi:diacylglycerol kinase family enzyme